MSTKPDYEAAFHWIARHTDNNDSITRDDMRQAVDAALGGDPLAFAVAALIAEGGEIETAWRTDEDNTVVYTPGEGRYLVYGPIPAEEETTT